MFKIENFPNYFINDSLEFGGAPEELDENDLVKILNKLANYVGHFSSLGFRSEEDIQRFLYVGLKQYRDYLLQTNCKFSWWVPIETDKKLNEQLSAVSSGATNCKKVEYFKLNNFGPVELHDLCVILKIGVSVKKEISFEKEEDVNLVNVEGRLSKTVTERYETEWVDALPIVICVRYKKVNKSVCQFHY